MRITLDGSCLVVGCADGMMRWINSETGQNIRTVDTAHGWTLRLAMSQDGEFLAASGYGPSVTLWSSKSGKLIRAMDNADTTKNPLSTVGPVAFSPDDSKIALVGSSSIGGLIWDVSTGKNLSASIGEGSEVNAVCWTPDGQSTVTASEDRIVLVRNPSTSRTVRQFQGHAVGVYGLAVAGEVAYSCSGPDGVVIAWKIHSPRTPIELKSQSRAWLNAVCFTPDGMSMYSVEGGNSPVARAWDLRSARLSRTFSGHTDNVYSLALTPTADALLTGSGDTTARLWDVKTGACRTVFRGHSGPVLGVACHPGGVWIATASADGNVWVWDSTSGSPTRKMESRSTPANRVVTDAGGRSLVASYEDGVIIVWDTTTWREVRRVKHGSVRMAAPSIACLPLAITPDGRFLISGGTNHRLCVWDMATGNTVWARERTDLAAPILSIALLPGGKQFVTGGGVFGTPGELKVWNTDTGENTFTLAGGVRENYGVAVNPNDGALAACSHDGVIKVYGLQTAHAAGQATRRRADSAFERGLAHRSQGEYDDAVAAFRAAIAIDPTNAEYGRELADTTKAKSNRESTIAEAQQAKEADAHHTRGHRLQVEGDLAGAVAAFRAGLAVGPEAGPQAARERLCLGRVLTAIGDPEAATATFAEVTLLQPTNANAHRLLGLALLEAALPDRAAAACREAVRLAPDDESHDALGLVLRAQGKLTDAVETFRTALQLKPHSLGVQRHLRETERWQEFAIRLPNFVNGTDAPESPAEAAEVALYCQQPFRKNYDLAVRLYRDAFDGDPKLLSKPNFAHNAACAAVLLAGGGDPTVTLGHDEWYFLHATARSWLSADLAAQVALIPDATPAERQGIRRRLESTLRDRDLRAARDPAALAVMPADESAAWANYWKKLASAIESTRTPAKLP